MTTLSYTFTAGAQKQVKGGRTFKIESATDPVTVEILSKTGTRVDVISGMTIGKGFQLPEGFGSLIITSATAQTITINVTDLLLTSDSIEGTVDIADNAQISETPLTADAIKRIYTCSISNSVALYNPVGSNRVLRVMRCQFTNSSAVATNVSSSIRKQYGANTGGVNLVSGNVFKMNSACPASSCAYYVGGSFASSESILAFNSSMYNKFFEPDFHALPIILNEGEGLDSSQLSAAVIWEEV